MAIKPTSRISPKKSTGNMRLTALIIISAVLCVNRALGTSTAQENSHKSYGRDLCAVRTNLVYDCLAIPSLGVEIPFGRGLSVGLDGYYAWWSKRSKVRYWRAQGVELSLRKYFGHSPLTGHHVGVYSQLMRYDFCLGKHGFLSGGSGAAFFDHPTWGVGIEYGYSLKLGKRLRLDTSLGIGWLTGRYMKYEAMDGHSVYRSAHNRKWFGPTRLGASLVWIIGKGGPL